MSTSLAVSHHAAIVHEPFSLYLGFALAVVAIALTLRPLQHPRWRVRLAGACYVVAGGLVVAAFFSVRWLPEVVVVAVVGSMGLVAAWEWPFIRDKIHYDFRSPIVRRAHRPTTPPVQLGSVNFELQLERAMAGFVRSTEAISARTLRNSKKQDRDAARLQKAAGTSVQRRDRALRRGARSTHRQAQGFMRAARHYREQVDRMLDGYRGIIANVRPEEDFQVFAASTAELRTSTIALRGSLETNRTIWQAMRVGNIHQAVNAAADEMVAAYDVIIESNALVLEYCDWVADIATQRARP